MDSFASKRSDRVAAAVFALLLQLGFITLLIQAMRPTAMPQKLVQELIFVLPRLTAPTAQSAPTTIDARGTPRPIVEAPAPASPITLPPAASSPTTAPSPDLSGLGQSIFGCAPENYANLTSQQRAHCPRPGEGYAIQETPDLLHPPRSHSKDEALWQEQWRRDRVTLGPCTGDGVVDCLLDQKRAEDKLEKDFDREWAEHKAKSLEEPKHPLPQNIGAYQH